MRSFVVDASVWVARLVPNDNFYNLARSWLDRQRLAGSEFLAPALLLTEVAGAISRRTGLAKVAMQAVEGLEMLPGLRLVEMDRSLVRRATGLAAELGMRGPDAYYVAVADRLQLALVTLDNDQKQRAAKAVKVQDLSDVT